MNNEQILTQFEEIEQKVERVIEVCKSYEATISELRHKIEQLEGELNNKVEAVKRYKEERTLIRSKIESLLAKLGILTGD